MRKLNLLKSTFASATAFVMTFAVLTIGSAAIGTWSVRADDPKANAEEGKAVAAEDAKKVEENEEEWKPKSKAKLRRELTALQYNVTQNEATEPAFRNRYWNNKQKGVYKCIVCEQDLFTSNTKYKSGTGWPSFWAPLNKESVAFRADNRLFYTRVEVHCKRCKAHLGHVFDDGPKPTGKRYCMNSASLKFVEKDEAKEEE